MWRRIGIGLLVYLGMSSLFIVPYNFRRAGTGFERAHTYDDVRLSDTHLYLSFSIELAMQPRPYGGSAETRRRGWASVPLSDLAWYGPDYPQVAQRLQRALDRSHPELRTDVERSVSESAGADPLAVRIFHAPQPAEVYERFMEDSFAAHDSFLVKRGDALTLVFREQRSDVPRFAFIEAPERPYEAWWAASVYVATYPARLVLVGGFAVLVAVLGMH